MKIFDIHAHIFPDAVAQQMTANIEAFYTPYVLKPHGDGTLADCIRQMDAAGTAKFAVNQVALRPHASAKINAFILAAHRSCPERIVPLASIHPEQKAVDDYVLQAKAAGFAGFKIHPDMQRFQLDGDAAMPMLRAIAAAGMPVLVHCGDRRFDFDGPRRVAGLHACLPELRAIYAHLGGWTQLDEAARLLADSGALFDLSGVLGELEPQRAAALIRAYGCKNVLYGSDYPMYAPAEELARFLRLPLTSQEREDILWNNAARLGLV